MPHLVAFAGTNSQHSTNQKLIDLIARRYADKAQITVLSLDQLPLFHKELARAVPAVVSDFVNQIRQADGIIIATPEYDHAVTAVLMNALEWCSIPPRPFVHQPVLVMGASYGSLGASRAQTNLRQILDAPELKARLMPGTEFLVERSLQAFDDAGDLKSAAKTKQLDRLINQFLVFIQLSHKLAEEGNK